MSVWSRTEIKLLAMLTALETDVVIAPIADMSMFALSVDGCVECPIVNANGASAPAKQEVGNV